ncbi:glycosyltransferase [uncultured Brevundimonas sp.]|uniref:glycosyltransferase n=1 Tax=uncultured Brevundimonas sp. TaxID=213418 RepID=UPI0026077A34|nr:glycosyltransferase [uncultured Brevundimonas sp.]
MLNIIDDKLASALCEGRFLVNVNNLCSAPIRTGVQRVCYEFWQRWPYRDVSIPFLEIDSDTIGLLDPSVLDDIRALFEDSDPILEAFKAEYPEIRMEPNVGWLGLASARNRVVAYVKVKPALDTCRAVIALEESLNQNFFDIAASYRPEKVMHLCHDFLIWTHSEHFNVNWNAADNIVQSLVNRRRYGNNFFTSTTTREVYTSRINPGDERHYRVIAPGADAFGRTYRTEVPASDEFVVVGTLEPRKQPIQILEAFERINKSKIRARLCFAGRMGWLAPADRERLEKAFKSYAWLRWIDGPDDAELRRLIMEARATIYLSLAEGFGSPPVESLALGVPCIVSEVIPSVVDMADNGQRRIAPDHPQELTRAVEDLLDDDILKALQDDIANLELPTWRAFVEGIAAMAEELYPSKGPEVAALPYSSMLEFLGIAGRFRELPREGFIRLAGDVLKLDAKSVQEVLQRSTNESWNSFDTLIAACGLLPDGRLKNAVIAAALAGTIPVESLPAAQEGEWRSDVLDLLSTNDYRSFIKRVYSVFHKRGASDDELDGQIPYRVGEVSRLKHLVDAINSDEYRNRVLLEINDDAGEGYFEKNTNFIFDLRKRYLKGLSARYSVERSRYIADNENFVRKLYQDLAYSRVSDRNLAIWSRHASTLSGRYKVAMDILLRPEAVIHATDTGEYYDLITDAARRSAYYPLVKTTSLDLVGRVALSQEKVLSPRELLRVISGRTNGVFDGDLLEVVSGQSVDERISFAATWAMIAGYAEWTQSILQWAAEQIGKKGAASARPITSRAKNPVIAFQHHYGREPNVSEASIIASASSNAVAAAAIVAASTRLSISSDPLAAVTWVLDNRDAIIQQVEEIESLCTDLMLVCPPLEGAVLKERAIPAVSHAGSEPAEPEGSQAMFGEIVTVSDLLSLDGKDFVSTAYRKILLREADTGGMATYLKLLDAPRGKEKVIHSLATSPEGKSKGLNVPGLLEFLQAYKPAKKKQKFGMKKFIRILRGKSKSANK